MTSLPCAPPASDGALVAAHLCGDRDAGEELVRRFHGRLVARMRTWCGSHDEAEDLAQHAWANAFGALERFDQTAPLWPWLKRIGDNTAHKRHRKSHVRGSVRQTPVDHEVLEALGGGEDPMDRIDDGDLLHRAWDRLPSRHQHVLGLVDLQGLTHDEAAASLGLKPNALRQLLFRARAKLREHGTVAAGFPLLRWMAPQAAAFKTLSLGGITGGVATAVAVPVLVVLTLGMGAPAHPSPFARVALDVAVDASPAAEAVVVSEQAAEGSRGGAAVEPETAVTPDGPSTSVPPPTPDGHPSASEDALPEYRAEVPVADRTVSTRDDEGADYDYGVDVGQQDPTTGEPIAAGKTGTDDEAHAAIEREVCQAVGSSTSMTYCRTAED